MGVNRGYRSAAWPVRMAVNVQSAGKVLATEYGAVCADYNVPNLGSVLLESYCCAKRTTHPGYDLKISRVEDKRPRS